MPSKKSQSNPKYTGNPANPQRFAKTIHVRIPRLILITGIMGTGKSTLARILCATVGYQKFSFGDLVRQEIIERACSIGDGSPPPGIPDLARQGWHAVRDDSFIIYRKPTPPEIRNLLQWYGTDYRRTQDPLYWVHKAVGAVDAMLYAGPVVIDDYRFHEEGQLGRMLNVKPLRVRLIPERTMYSKEDAHLGLIKHESEQLVSKLTVEVSYKYEHTLDSQTAVLRSILAGLVPCSRMTVKLPQSFLA